MLSRAAPTVSKGRCKDPEIAELVHLNGPPGVGKSTVARGLVARRSLALDLDIDDIRTRLGNWQRDPVSKQVARSLGFDLARIHLDAGRDVVMPQLLLSIDAIHQVEAIATSAGATLVEVVLVAPAEEILGRLEVQGPSPHPRNAFSMDELSGQIDHALAALRSHARARKSTHLADVASMDQGTAVTYVASLIGW